LGAVQVGDYRPLLRAQAAAAAPPNLLALSQMHRLIGRALVALATTIWPAVFARPVRPRHRCKVHIRIAALRTCCRQCVRLSACPQERLQVCRDAGAALTMCAHVSHFIYTHVSTRTPSQARISHLHTALANPCCCCCCCCCCCTFRCILSCGSPRRRCSLPYPARHCITGPSLRVPAGGRAGCLLLLWARSSFGFAGVGQRVFCFRLLLP